LYFGRNFSTGPFELGKAFDAYGEVSNSRERNYKGAGFSYLEDQKGYLAIAETETGLHPRTRSLY
jgi:hypothetical protein